MYAHPRINQSQQLQTAIVIACSHKFVVSGHACAPMQVVPISDYNNNVRDARCWGSDCGNKGAVAFHACLGNFRMYKDQV